MKRKDTCCWNCACTRGHVSLCLLKSTTPDVSWSSRWTGNGGRPVPPQDHFPVFTGAPKKSYMQTNESECNLSHRQCNDMCAYQMQGQRDMIGSDMCWYEHQAERPQMSANQLSKDGAQDAKRTGETHQGG